jgi:hypothetical protein
MSTQPADYTYWKARLSGVDPGLTLGQAEPGFYRKPERDGGYTPIAIWRNGEGDIVAKVGVNGRVVEASPEWCERYFAWCAKHPVSEESYRAFLRDGRWLDDVPDVDAAVAARVAATSDGQDRPNATGDIVIRETIAELRDEAERWLASIGGEIRSQEEADRAGNFARRFAELEKEAETARIAEKEPHLKASREVDQRWSVVRDFGKDAKKWATALVGPWLRAQKEKLAAAGAEGRVKAGSRGRSVHLRTVKRLEMDYMAVFDLYSGDDRFTKHEDVQKALERVVRADLESGKDVPGAKLILSQEAA